MHHLLKHPDRNSLINRESILPWHILHGNILIGMQCLLIKHRGLHQNTRVILSISLKIEFLTSVELLLKVFVIDVIRWKLECINFYIFHCGEIVADCSRTIFIRTDPIFKHISQRQFSRNLPKNRCQVQIMLSIMQMMSFHIEHHIL